MGNGVDPVGYVYDGCIYCPDCINREGLCDNPEVGAILDYSETDSPDHCGDCGALIHNTLTTDGYKDLVARIVDFQFEFWEDLLREYMDLWNGFDWFVIPTFAGMMDPFGNIKDRW